jgi:hypothetical protein
MREIKPILQLLCLACATIVAIDRAVKVFERRFTSQ